MFDLAPYLNRFEQQQRYKEQRSTSLAAASGQHKDGAAAGAAAVAGASQGTDDGLIAGRYMLVAAAVQVCDAGTGSVAGGGSSRARWRPAAGGAAAAASGLQGDCWGEEDVELPSYMQHLLPQQPSAVQGRTAAALPETWPLLAGAAPVAAREAALADAAGSTEDADDAHMLLDTTGEALAAASAAAAAAAPQPGSCGSGARDGLDATAAAGRNAPSPTSIADMSLEGSAAVRQQQQQQQEPSALRLLQQMQLDDAAEAEAGRAGAGLLQVLGLDDDAAQLDGPHGPDSGQHLAQLSSEQLDQQQVSPAARLTAAGSSAVNELAATEDAAVRACKAAAGGGCATLPRVSAASWTSPWTMQQRAVSMERAKASCLCQLDARTRVGGPAAAAAQHAAAGHWQQQSRPRFRKGSQPRPDHGGVPAAAEPEARMPFAAPQQASQQAAAAAQQDTTAQPQQQQQQAAAPAPKYVPRFARRQQRYQQLAGGSSSSSSSSSRMCHRQQQRLVSIWMMTWWWTMRQQRASCRAAGPVRVRCRQCSCCYTSPAAVVPVLGRRRASSSAAGGGAAAAAAAAGGHASKGCLPLLLSRASRGGGRAAISVHGAACSRIQVSMQRLQVQTVRTRLRH
ncbi:hypothetical protein COO60DRAFT_606868 [Scenedesmus sp. NREL 46B-D3]|nr:hypothetical protein COO60DRAFT_606868 [Scenedesmus sp. NREL 46B-D3]